MTVIRSIIAVLAGLVFIFVTHIGTDQILHAQGVFPPEGQAISYPTVRDGARGVRFIEAVIESGRRGGAWVGLDAR